MFILPFSGSQFPFFQNPPLHPVLFLLQALLVLFIKFYFPLLLCFQGLEQGLLLLLCGQEFYLQPVVVGVEGSKALFSCFLLKGGLSQRLIGVGQVYALLFDDLLQVGKLLL